MSFGEQPFTIAEAADVGISAKMLRSKRWVRVFRGVYVAAGIEITTHVKLAAALKVLPDDAVVSHRSALLLWGLDLRGWSAIELSTRSGRETALPGVTLHRRLATIAVREVDGLPVTSPERTLVDSALRLSMVEIVQAAEHLALRGATTLDRLREYAQEQHLHGVRRVRRALRWAVEGAESPRETVLRLMLVFARLPSPQVNADVLDVDGCFVARVDLLLERWKVIVEYDGAHHREPGQWQRDLLRRERLERLGYLVVVVTAADLRRPTSVPWRVHAALVDHGYTGPRPVLSDTWRRWFSF